MTEKIDSGLSTLSLVELQAKREELADKIRVIDETIDTKKTERAKELMDELRSLGISPSPSVFNPTKAKSKITRSRDPNKPCPVCGELGHDGRKHRQENLAKKST
jgi:DNA repair exonuclease SbcCD ATPase subunit